MRTVVSLFSFALLGTSFASGPEAVAQSLASAGIAAPVVSPRVATYATSDEVQAAIAQAKREIKPGAALVQIPLLSFKPYTAFLEYRRAAWVAASHPDFEMFFVIEGRGTLILGGDIVGGTPGANGNISGSSVVGGQSRAVSKGDFFVVPPQTVHMFPKPDDSLVLITMHLPTGSQP